MVIGAEYAQFSGDGKGKKKGKSPEISSDLTEEEKRYVYQNAKGKIIFTPVFQAYGDAFMGTIIDNTRIRATYDLFRDTSWFEKYRLNTYQFSAAKDAATCQMLQAQVFDEDGKRRSFSKFRGIADEIQKTTNEVYLRVEYENCTRQAIMATKFNDFRADADLYPYWMYQTREDNRVRPEHAALEGLIFRIGDSYGDKLFPPADWNCRCTGKQLDDMYLKSKNRSVQTDEQARGWLEGIDKDTGKPFVDEQFRYNPADQGMMPRQGSYHQVLPSANGIQANMFSGLTGSGEDRQAYSAHAFNRIMNTVEDWRKEYHTDHLGNIIFQNADLLFNVVFTNLSIHNAQKHPQGFQAIPETIIHPDEVWMTWESVEEQDTVLINYLKKFKNTSYIVRTRAGAVHDAVLLSNRQAEKSRVGCPWISQKG